MHSAAAFSRDQVCCSPVIAKTQSAMPLSKSAESRSSDARSSAEEPSRSGASSPEPKGLDKGLEAMGELKERLEVNMGKVVDLFHEWCATTLAASIACAG